MSSESEVGRLPYEEDQLGQGFPVLGAVRQYAAELTDEIIVVTKGHSPYAALVPLANVDRESLAVSTHPEFMKLITRARRRFAAGRTLDLEEMRTRVRRMSPPPGNGTPAPRRSRRG